MRFLLAPDSFKGSLSAPEAAEAMADGIRRGCPDALIVLLPLADGGEGTVESLVTATQGRRHSVQVIGPLGTPVQAIYGTLGGDGQTALIEMAQAAGLPLVPVGQRDPRRTTTYGVGELLKRVLESGVETIIVGLGGSATNDGGAGAMQALGVRFLDADGTELLTPLTGGDLTRLAHVDADGLRSPPNVRIIIASDVSNTLCGPTGASAVYGPQKGADSLIVAELDAGLANYANVLRRDLGVDIAECPGAGAAGGLGAGLMAFLGAEMRSGIDLILDTAGFEEKAQGVNWVFTGEGRIDEQTLQGKTISGVLRRSQALRVPVIAFGGAVDDAAAERLAERGLRAAFPIVSGPMTLEEAMNDGRRLLTEAAARVARLLCQA